MTGPTRPDQGDRYRVTLCYFGLWAATVHGDEAYDYVPGMTALGFTSAQALRRAIAKADRRNTPTRSALVDPKDYR